MGFLLHLLYRWTSMLKRTTNVISRNWDVALSTLLFVVVKLLYRMYQWRHLTDSPTVSTICPEFGSHRRWVRVHRVARL
ncbi:hypothetical protein PIB30_069005, partial [Stylosanthes scabra]|nr:hypothetical protein [Stylosanthes scabra]